MHGFADKAGGGCHWQIAGLATLWMGWMGGGPHALQMFWMDDIAGGRC